MFDRKKYKSFAKTQLKGRWAIPLIITAIVMLVEFLFTLPSLIKTMTSESFWYLVNSSTSSLNDYEKIINVYNSSNPLLVTIIQGVVTAILEVASIQVFLKMTYSPEPVNFSSFLEGLNDWLRAILAYLWRGLWTFLWMTLTIPLLSIPGIIKGLAYSQTYYLVAENKNLSIPKALKISMLITRGHKGELFVMYLSFIGWSILASIPAGLGFIVLLPYMRLTYINAYHAMMSEAFESGRLRQEDLSE